MPLTYFSLWMTRLMGLLPDIGHCMVCGEDIGCRRSSLQCVCRWALLRAASQRERRARCRADCWQLAQRMLRAPAASFCRRAMAAEARAGSAAVYAADAGAASGAEAEDGGGAGAAGRVNKLTLA